MKALPSRVGTSADSGAKRLNAKILAPLANYIRDEHGERVLDELVGASGLSEKALSGRTHWASVTACESFLAGAAELIPDEAAFAQACGYQLAQSLGPVRYLLRAASPGAVLERAFSSLDTISSFSSVEILERGSHHLRVRYTSTHAEGRQLCLSRQGATAQFPTIWGLSPASFVEESCIAKGDDACVYGIGWQETRRWWPQVVGLAVGLAAAAGVAASESLLALSWLALPLLGWALGFAYEVDRAHQVNAKAFEESQSALLAVAREEAEARQEVLALNARQAEWTRLMEEQVAARTAAFEHIVDQLQSVQSEQVVALRGVTHDLRNPLSVLSMVADVLQGEDDAGAHAELITMHRMAVRQMEDLLSELLVHVKADVEERRMPATVVVAAVCERTRATLKALSYGRPVSITVFSTRDAPAEIQIDPLLLDRIIDNLLTNAVKYTERGSIVVELGGAPGFLTFKISDTGRGIAPENIEKVFSPGGSDSETRAPGSLGIGLSSVVSLLAEVGGRLEVMSKPAQGSTFCAYVPVEPTDERTADDVVLVRHLKGV